MPSASRLSVPESFALASAKTVLQPELRLGRPVRRRGEVTYYDTFDWRLHRQGGRLRLTRGDQAPSLCWSHRSIDLTQPVEVVAAGEPLELPPGEVRRQVAPLIGVRCLLPVAAADISSQAAPVLDGLRKTIGWLRLESGRVHQPLGGPPCKLPRRLVAEALRGYEDELEATMARLIADLELEPVVADRLAEMLAPLGRAPGDYSSKLQIDLDPSEDGQRALCGILAGLLQTMARNQPGVVADLDPEFLHDFRVAVRRTRAALSQLGDVLPGPRVQTFRRGFAWLGKATGACRDLDVLALAMPDYLGDLPAEVGARLEPLSRELQRRHRQARGRLRRTLGTDRYGRLVASWRAYLEETSQGLSGVTVRALATERISGAAERTRKRAAKLTPRSPDRDLHSLRIQCKKLRYLLEFFRSLYEPRAAGRLIGAVKAELEGLGTLQDLSVHSTMLDELARGGARRGGLDAGGLLAAGRLLAALEARRLLTRRQLLDSIERFRDRQLARVGRLVEGG